MKCLSWPCDSFSYFYGHFGGNVCDVGLASIDLETLSIVSVLQNWTKTVAGGFF